MKLKYNTSHEVNEQQYIASKRLFKGLIAHRKGTGKDKGKYFIKPLTFMSQKRVMEEILTALETKEL